MRKKAIIFLKLTLQSILPSSFHLCRDEFPLGYPVSLTAVNRIKHHLPVKGSLTLIMKHPVLQSDITMRVVQCKKKENWRKPLNAIKMPSMRIQIIAMRIITWRTVSTINYVTPSNLHCAKTADNVALQRCERFEEAVTEYEKTIALDDQHQLAYYNLGYIFFNNIKRPKDGVTMLKKSLEIDPDDVDAQINMALAFNDLGMIEDAIKSYQYIIARNNKSVMAHFNLGSIFCFNNSDGNKVFL